MTGALRALEDWEGTEAPATAALSESDVVRMVVAMRSTPSQAVPPSASRWAEKDREVTGRDVARAYAALSDLYSVALIERDNAREELRTLKADVATMRRVLFGAAGAR